MSKQQQKKTPEVAQVKSNEIVKQQLETKKQELLDMKKKLEQQVNNKKVNEIKAESEKISKALDSLVKTMSTEDKKKYQSEIQEINKIKEELVTNIGQFKNELDQTEKEVQTMVNALEKTENTSVSENTVNPTTTGTEKKSFFGRTIDWVKGEKDEEYHTAKFIGRSALVGTGLYLAVKGVQSLWRGIFGGKKETSEGGEKKKFFDTGFGKVLKWGALGIGGFFGIKWLLDYFGDKDKTPDADTTDGAEEQAEDVKKLKENDPERFEKYKGLGENIDSQYNQIMKKEIDTGWGGMSIADGYKKYVDQDISFDDFRATIPMCIDNEFSNVNSLLSEGSYYAYLMKKDIKNIQTLVLGWGKDKIEKVLGPYLLSLTSFIPFKGKDRNENLSAWFASGKPEDRKAELDLFFRQYVKVINYTHDKRYTLMEKIAQEKFDIVGGEYSTLSDAMNDSEWLEEYVYSDSRYTNFTNGKLHQAIDVMKDQQIFDDTLSHDMEKQMKAANAERDAILKTTDNKDYIAVLHGLSKNDQKLTAKNCTDGLEVTKKIKKDVEDNFEKDWTYLFFGSAHTAFNSEQKNIQEFLEKSGLKTYKTKFIEDMSDFEKKFAGNQLGKQDIVEYTNKVNAYFAMKKEILIGAKAIQQMKKDDPNPWVKILNIGGAIFSDFLYHGGKSIKAFKDKNRGEGYLLATFPLLAGGSLITGLGKWSKSKKIANFGRFVRDLNVISVSWRLKGKVVRRLPLKNFNKMPFRLLKSRYDVPNGDVLLFQDVVEGKVHGKKAQDIVTQGNSRWKRVNKSSNSLSEFIQDIAGKTDTELSAKHIQTLFLNDADIAFTKNPTIRALFFTKKKNTRRQKAKGVWNGFVEKTYVPSGVHHVEVLEKFFGGEAGVTAKYKKLTENQQKLFKELIYGGKFKEIEDLTNLTQNIDKINIEGLDHKQITSLALEMSENIGDFSDSAKVQKKVETIVKNTASNTVGEVASEGEDIIKNTDELVFPKHQFIEHLDAELSQLEAELNMEIKSKNPNGNMLDNLEKRYNQVEELRKSLKVKNADKLSKAESDLLDTLSGVWGKCKNADEMVDLVKIIQKSNIDDVKIKSLDDLIKHLDDTGVRKTVGLSDDAINGVQTMLKNIETDIVAKQLAKSSDEIFGMIKSIFKIIAKAT